mmetsp:Transcript_35712/g.79433  ORF Transcript_35712/g.79433 Transcript_35712/m.79433 type:complete len:396 (+) Transcript_35712:147-1334(+)|eukprot:CAMPEP_0202905536 /NCGR_PEP_ID=MMETSP1392-20130828/34724_1 /ASSEMBLY_ACC=CAM_ASM_000868 /TAXON_ID=225041 /ORGANISM="Chlamydomonas chlamydogama, Strain SAG 11-48b" /LENGTH=395 /DNA_ID=CAMNT_0049593659 /DNA_START=101 /DNA_END=1288 /DNA_ORIENTATION=+
MTNKSYGLASALTYGTIAIAANFVNKHAMALLPGLPNSVLMLQLSMSVLVVLVLRAGGALRFPVLSLARCWALLPMSLTYAAHAAFVLRSLAALNVAIYNTLKRLTPVMVLVSKAVIERKAPAAHDVRCVALVVGGCILTGAGDLGFDPIAYTLALVCAALQAAYMLLTEYAPGQAPSDAQQRPALPQGHDPGSLQHSSTAHAAMTVHPEGASDHNSKVHISGAGHLGKEDFSNLRNGSSGGAGRSTTSNQEGVAVAAELLWYASLTSLPCVAVVAAASGELPHLPTSLQSASGALGGPLLLVPWLLLVAGVECTLTGSLVWCTRSNDATTTSVVGVLKGVVAVILGMFIMAGNTRCTWLNVLGMSIVMVAGVYYASIKWFSGGVASSGSPAKRT